MNPLAGIALVTAALGLLLLAVQWAARFPAVGGELRRKLVHVGMGLLTLTFPWLFQESWPVWLLAGAATGALWLIRSQRHVRRLLGRALHDVPRTSWGELCFPWAVAMVFWLSRGDPVMFGIPVLMLTLADAAGALAGGRYGRAGFKTPEGGNKSVEGSLAVFGVAFLCAHLPLLLMTNTGRAESVCAALTLALLVTLMESVAVRGLDNLIIPLGAFFLLQIYREMEAGDLLLRFLITGGLLVMVVFMRRWHGLDAGATIGCALLGYGAVALGGWLFLTPLLGFYVRHVAALLLRPRLREYLHGIVAVLSIAASCLPWLGWFYLEGGPGLGPFVLAVCLHSALNYHGGLLSGDGGAPWRKIMESTFMALAFSVLPLAGSVEPGLLVRVGAVSVLLVPAALVIGTRVLPRQADGCYAVTETRFAVQSLIAFAGASALLIAGL
jgi:phytol kinase